MNSLVERKTVDQVSFSLPTPPRRSAPSLPRSLGRRCAGQTTTTFGMRRGRPCALTPRGRTLGALYGGNRCMYMWAAPPLWCFAPQHAVDCLQGPRRRTLGTSSGVPFTSTTAGRWAMLSRWAQRPRNSAVQLQPRCSYAPSCRPRRTQRSIHT